MSMTVKLRWIELLSVILTSIGLSMLIVFFVQLNSRLSSDQIPIYGWSGLYEATSPIWIAGLIFIILGIALSIIGLFRKKG